ncbi:3-deoxy-D-manno-octulosonic acid transferase [Roseovarius aestuarii]|uniref:3-deoxy-D-manno-octulosonic acid transferase n=1 Tax=Roseovarius aestuarii TaxID=475083 RepID=A0A1X7BS68_9RHOB|nr:glycosyltransferase N-terminal domain-containing protein [Roseovarius aestuarii]SMC12453.1 3-deoxy-D-manno-octulosonic acid transferase [Roseovarius aestuarii]
MGRSLSLAAYLAYARGTPRAFAPPSIARPAGELIWAHAADGSRADALVQLAERLAQQRPGLRMLLTSSGDLQRDRQIEDPVIWQIVPQDSVADAEAFLKHWTPDLCLWTGGNVLPALICSADTLGIPLYLVDAEEHMLIRPGWRWFPDLPKALYSKFSVIMVRSAAAARELRRIGTGSTEVTVTGPFQEGTVALPYNQSDHDELSALLRGRHVWLAAMAQPDELPTILEAHRRVSKFAHRALLVIVPDDITESDAFRKQLEAGDWRHVIWSDGELPEETTQILLADTTGELGLWYLLATVTFMGSSLFLDQTGRDPNEPVAHGSAVLYGPNVSRYVSRYSRYAAAGAACVVQDADTLAAAVQRLIAPDEAAMMAHAAWDVASQSAAVTDQILDLVQDTLDVLEAKT